MVIITSFKQPESPIIQEEKNVQVLLDKKNLGCGTLYVSESTFCWQEKDDVGFSIGYTDISLHAISRDRNVHTNDCLYIIVDSHFYLTEESRRINDEDENSDSESNPDISELILIPENTDAITSLYNALKLCQELNPDLNDMDDDDVGDNMYADAEDEMEDEGHYELNEPVNHVDSEVAELSQRLQGNSVNIHYNSRNGEHSDGNDDEFEDAD